MSNPKQESLVQCRDLSQKLLVLYEFVGRTTGLEQPRNDSRLAEYLGIARATVSAWRNGKTDKSRPIHMVLPSHISALSKLYILLAPHIAENDTYNLWVDADVDTFRRRLKFNNHNALLELLETKEQTLEVSAETVPQGLGLIREDYLPEEGDWIIDWGTHIRLSVSGKKKRTILVISNGPTGLLWLSPSTWHDGKIKSIPEIIPTDTTGWEIVLEGKTELFCIEMAVPTPTYVRPVNGAMDLTPKLEKMLVDELTDPSICHDWRYCKIPILVKSKPA